MKTVYLSSDNTVREIIPGYALPVETFYGPNFAARCAQAPDIVEQGWSCDPATGEFAPPADPEPAAPTEAEHLRADLDYVAAMLGVEL